MKRYLGMLVTLCLMFSYAVMADAARTKITLTTYGGPDQEQFFQLVKAGFEKDNPNYELEYTLVPQTEYINKMLVNLVAGTAPDVFLTWAQYKSQWVEEGLLYDFTDRVNQSRVYRLDRFFPVIKDNVSYQGRIYGAPWGFNATLFWANRDLLDVNGIAVPQQEWTYDDLRNLSKKIANPEQRIFGTMGMGPSGDGTYIQQMYNWAGHGYLDATQRKVLVNSEGSVRLLEYWRAMYIEDRVVPAGQFLRKTNTDVFVAGDLAFWKGYTSDTNRLASFKNSGVQTVRTAMLRWPKATYGQSSTAQGHLWTAPATHPEPEKAWKLIEWLGSEACDYIWASSQRTPPITANPRHWDAYNKTLSADERARSISFIMDLLNNSYTKDMQYWPTFNQMQAVMSAMYNQVVTNKIAPKQAMEMAVQQMQAIQDEYWKTKSK